MLLQFITILLSQIIIGVAAVVLLFPRLFKRAVMLHIDDQLRIATEVNKRLRKMEAEAKRYGGRNDSTHLKVVK
jgi:hypothetical protein